MEKAKGLWKDKLTGIIALLIIGAYLIVFLQQDTGSSAPLPGWLMLTILMAIGLILIFSVMKIGRTKGTTADDFLTGGRGVGHGMTNASIVATWIWAATLMTSSWTAYSFGYIGPWWYGLGAVLPLPIIGFLGKRLRHVMPNVRSYPEFISHRLDKKNHILLTIISIVVSGVVAIMIVSGASVMAVSYANIPYWIVAMILLIIFVSYTSIAGLWASIFCDTIMTLFMYAAMAILVFGILFSVGPGKIYDGLVNVMTTKAVLQPEATAATQENQLDPLNIANIGGIGFLMTNIIGNLGAVLCNQTYWVRTIAAKDDKTIMKSFGTASFCWTPIPIAVATALGLYALSQKLMVGKSYTNGGITMLFTEADAVAPLGAFVALGVIGLLFFVIATLGASISTGAGEIMSMTTCIVNDVYKGHLKKDATDKEILRMSKAFLWICAALIYVIVMILRTVNFPFSGMYQAMGIAFSSAVIPVILSLAWKKTNRDGVFWAIIFGAAAGVAYWLYTGFDMNWGVVISNIIVITVSTITVMGWSILKPENYIFKNVKAKEGNENAE
ncbi:MAG: hypothetical protein GX663_00020 [Clostridiales bacterium]|nr:hypothetical protein [Clostridiales bacterium]